jgi:hypothetical protein
MAIEPLVLPDRYRSPNRMQRFLRDVPIFGLLAQMRRHFCSVLRNRTSAVVSEWGSSVEVNRCLCVVSPLVQAYFRWPNSYFIPDDPCKYLLWDTSWGGLLDCEFMVELTEKLSLPDDFFECCDSMTYGQFIHKIVKHLHITNQYLP